MSVEASSKLDLRPTIPFTLEGPVIGPRLRDGILSSFNAGGVVLNYRDSLLFVRENDKLAIPGEPDTTHRMGLYLDNGISPKRIGQIDWRKTLGILSYKTGKELVSAEDARPGFPGKNGLVWVVITGVEKKGLEHIPWTVSVPFDLSSNELVDDQAILLNHYINASKNGIRHTDFDAPIQTHQVRQQGNDHVLTTIKSPASTPDQPLEIHDTSYPVLWWNKKRFGTTGSRFTLKESLFLQIYHGQEVPTLENIHNQYTIGAGISEINRQGQEEVKLGHVALATYDKVADVIEAQGKKVLSSDPEKAVLYLPFVRERGFFIEGLMTVGDREIWRIKWLKRDIINSINDFSLAA